jgi:hypothetical protein
MSKEYSHLLYCLPEIVSSLQFFRLKSYMLFSSPSRVLHVSPTSSYVAESSKRVNIIKYLACSAYKILGSYLKKILFRHGLRGASSGSPRKSSTTPKSMYYLLACPLTSMAKLLSKKQNKKNTTSNWFIIIRSMI